MNSFKGFKKFILSSFCLASDWHKSSCRTNLFWHLHAKYKGLWLYYKGDGYE